LLSLRDATVGVITALPKEPHHGKDPTKIDQLALIEEAEIKQFSRFLTLLKQTRESDASLRDQTVVISASNLGNASAHTGDIGRTISR
jgi:hypothetical protein